MDYGLRKRWEQAASSSSGSQPAAAPHKAPPPNVRSQVPPLDLKFNQQGMVTGIRSTVMLPKGAIQAPESTTPNVQLQWEHTVTVAKPPPQPQPKVAPAPPVAETAPKASQPSPPKAKPSPPELPLTGKYLEFRNYKRNFPNMQAWTFSNTENNLCISCTVIFLNRITNFYLGVAFILIIIKYLLSISAQFGLAE